MTTTPTAHRPLRARMGAVFAAAMLAVGGTALATPPPAEAVTTVVIKNGNYHHCTSRMNSEMKLYRMEGYTVRIAYRCKWFADARRWEGTFYASR